MNAFDITTVAFFLPQFHRTSFNNRHWGPGFTEWTNVAGGRPRFAGHTQPRLPADLGFYDLSNPDVLSEQWQMAAAHGISAFCFYYYRFEDGRELSLPVDRLLARSTPYPNFCYCWANEDWTRAWDGKSSEVLRVQSYDDITISGVVEDACTAMRDERYLTINGRPVFLIYQLGKVSQPTSVVERIRNGIRAQIGLDVLLGSVSSQSHRDEFHSFADFVVQFPPHRIPRITKRKLISPDRVAPFDKGRADFFEDYDAVVASSLQCIDSVPRLAPGVCPDWDNSPRRASEAHILVGSTPTKFEEWVRTASGHARRKAVDGDLPAPLLFVNAWNEWAEGAALEPSVQHGRAYLEALKAGLQHASGPGLG